MTKLKVAVIVSSLFASAAFAQSTPPSQASGAPAPTAQPPVQLAQGSGAPGAVSGGAQASGAAVGQAGAAAAAGGAGFAVPFGIAAGLTAIGAASTSDNGALQTTTSHFTGTWLRLRCG